MRDRIRELRRVRAGDLAAHPRNWRQHPPGQRAALAAVLDQVGYADALIARELADGSLQLIDGHLRADLDADATVPVLIVDLDEHEADVVLATLDPLTAMAAEDTDRLQALLAGVRESDRHLVTFLASGKAPDDGADEAAPEPPAEPITRPGDLWHLGDHRLLCGDATNAADVERLLAGDVPRLMVTDPPYGVNYDPAWRDAMGVGPRRDYMDADADTERAWADVWPHFSGDVAYVWHADHQRVPIQAALEAAGFEFRQEIIWVKPVWPFSRATWWYRHEPCLYLTRKGRSGGAINVGFDEAIERTNVWESAPPGIAFGSGGRDEDELTTHAAQKPLMCMARPIARHEGDVYDPFIGSGTTLIAAQQLGRRCYAMDVAPAYCDIVVARWEAFTGDKAEREPQP